MNNYIRYRLTIRREHFEEFPDENNQITNVNKSPSEISPNITLRDYGIPSDSSSTPRWLDYDAIEHFAHDNPFLFPVLEDFGDDLEPFHINKISSGNDPYIGRNNLTINYGDIPGYSKNYYDLQQPSGELSLNPYHGLVNSVERYLPEIAGDMFKSMIYRLHHQAIHGDFGNNIHYPIRSEHLHPALDEGDPKEILDKFAEHFADEYRAYRRLPAKNRPTFYDYYHREITPKDLTLLHDMGRHYTNILRSIQGV